MQRALIYLLYWTLQALAFPALLFYLLLRCARNRAYLRSLGERFGCLPRTFLRTVPGAIWLHAVSVGEVLSAAILLRRETLRGTPIFVSCSTIAGRAMAEQKLAGLAAGIFYAPLDYRFAVRRVLRALKPQLVAVMETEIWPNLYREAKRSGAGLLVLNGRISDKALPRYRRLRWFFRHILSWPDSIFAQDATAAARYRELGAERIATAGNLKYDFDPDSALPAAPVREFLDRLQPARVWIAASTMPPARDGDTDEDDLVLDAFSQLAPRHPGLLLLLAPRRPERFDEAARKLAARGIPFIRRSELERWGRLQPANQGSLELGWGRLQPAGGFSPAVLLLDTIGELAGLFQLAHVVFMGGTIAERGGHNILEPAAFGVPVITGPHMENFAEIAAAFRSGGGVLDISTGADLAPAVERLLTDDSLRESIAARGRELSSARRGATDRAAAAISSACDKAFPKPLHNLVARCALKPLEWLWRAGVRTDRALSNFNLDLPGRPVLSIGNLAMGGTGKTPFVLWLTERLAGNGHKPAILTRGYRRAEKRIVTLLPGELAPVESTGEEAQLILRQGLAALAICSDRRAARWALEQKYQPSVFLLDDGFQTWRTRRDLDIVLIDSIDPCRGGIFPLGRLREGFSALSRANIVILTRTRPGRAYEGLAAEIRRHNPRVPIFLARTVPEPLNLNPRASIGAFCALGQPDSFRQTLDDLSITPAFFETFPDHHHYTESEIRRLAASCEILLTTEKDLMNTPPAAAAECRVQAVKIRFEIENEAALLTLIVERLQASAART